MKKLIIANWKMNPLKGTEAAKIFKSINTAAIKLKNVETVVCPPLVYMQSLGQMVTSRNCVVGSQDAFWEHVGAFTGQVSADMIFNARGRYVIVGHSERRALGETDELVNKKMTSILQFPLIPVLCVGEKTRDDDSNYIKLVKQQVKNGLAGLSAEQISRVVVAYEPIWAIGVQARRVCTPPECREMVLAIRQALADVLPSSNDASKIPLLYGGSADSKNAAEFLNEGLVQGLLVGRASLDPKEFVAMLKIAEKVSG